MGKVYVLAGVLTVLGLFGLYLLVGAKLAQKMFSKKTKKEISK